MKPKESARPLTTASAPENTNAPTLSADPRSVNGEEAVALNPHAEVIALLREIVELLDKIDGSLANIEGRMP